MKGKCNNTKYERKGGNQWVYIQGVVGLFWNKICIDMSHNAEYNYNFNILLEINI